MALNDGSGLDQKELERLDSLMDKRIASLSAQLAKLDKINHVRGTLDGMVGGTAFDSHH